MKDDFTYSADINGLYEPDKKFSEDLYGVHAHFNESAMSYNYNNKSFPGESLVRGDVPHAADERTGKGLFMINKKGDIFFMSKNLAKFTLENIDPLNPVLRNKYIDQVFIGNIKQFKKSGK